MPQFPGTIPIWGCPAPRPIWLSQNPDLEPRLPNWQEEGQRGGAWCLSVFCTAPSSSSYQEVPSLHVPGLQPPAEAWPSKSSTTAFSSTCLEPLPAADAACLELLCLSALLGAPAGRNGFCSFTLALLPGAPS